VSDNGWSPELLAKALRASEDALFRQNVTTLELDALVERLSETIRQLTKGRRTFRALNLQKQAEADVRAVRVRQMLAEGRLVPYIAGKLGVSERTVRSLRGRGR
jgi:DNA-binding NarL/FixJ family response regulator